MTPQFNLTVECGNAAFGESVGERGQELARILREVAVRVENGIADNVRFSVHDLNGNRVGHAGMTGGKK
jgi:hypothetical protein